MRKLLVGVLIAVFGIFALAGSSNVTLNWSGSVTVTAKLTKDGIDIGYKFGAGTAISWGLTSSAEKSEKVTVNISWALPPAGLNLNSVEFDGDLLYLNYVNNGYTFSSNLLDSKNYGEAIAFGGDYLEFGIKSLPFKVSFVYIDQVDPDATTTFFDDGAAALGSFDLGVGDISYGAVYYMKAGAGYVAAFADFTGKDTLENLTVDLGYKQDGNKYGVKAAYSLDLLEKKLSIAPEVGYGEGWGGLGKYVKATVAFKQEFGENLSLTVNTIPAYNLSTSAFSASLGVTADITVNLVTLKSEFNIADVVSAPNTWTLKNTLTVSPTDALTIVAKVNTDNTFALTWNVTADYTVEKGLTAEAYYDNTNNWYLQLSYTASF